MGNMGLGGGYISDAGLSFKMVCLHLLEMAQMPPKVDDAPRIDIKVGGFDTSKETPSRVCYRLMPQSFKFEAHEFADYESAS